MRLTALLIFGVALLAQIYSSGDVFASFASEKYASVEFDNNMLWGTPDSKRATDLNRYSMGNPVPAGKLKVDVYLNDLLIGQQAVMFSPVQGSDSAQACFSAGELSAFGVILERLSAESARWLVEEENSSDCRFIESVIDHAETRFDYAEQRLDISIPQAYLVERSSDYISPKQWDRGITAGRLNYTADIFNSTSPGYSNTQGFAYFESGFNAAGWRLRNTSSLTADKSNRLFRTQRTYAQTDVVPLTSTLTIGRDYTDGQLFGSYGLQGVFLSTDSRMLPASLRNYAPVVSGQANSNAKVTIRQNNLVIYERAVPAGPFEISNLQVTGYGNDLEVTVTEADGSAKKFNVPYSPLVQLLRPGQAKHSASIGQAWVSSGAYSPKVAQVNYQYGVNNYLTAIGGGIVSDDYTSLALGGAISTKYGGLSADYTLSDSRTKASSYSTGDSVRVIYSTLIEKTNTNITLSSYRYSSRGFWSFNEFLANENSLSGYSDEISDFDVFRGAKQKGRFDVSLRQRLKPGYGSFFVGGYTRNFWNRKGVDTQYQLSYSNSFKDLSYDVSMARVKNQNNREYSEFRLNFSLPIFPRDGNSGTYLSSGIWHNSESGSMSQTQLGGVAGEDQQITYGISTTQGLDSQNPQRDYGVSGSYSGSKALATAGLSKGQGYQQASLGLAGSVLVHANGVAFGQTLGDTVALIEAKDAEGARITNASGAQIDGRGFGVVPYLSAYSRNRIEVDPEGISADVQMTDTSAETIPAAGSIVKVKFDTSKENSTLIAGVFDDGEPLPFGAEVLEQSTQRSVGFVGQAGVIFARGLKANEKILVKLKGGGCLISPSATEVDSDQNRPSVVVRRKKQVCKFVGVAP